MSHSAAASANPTIQKLHNFPIQGPKWSMKQRNREASSAAGLQAKRPAPEGSKARNLNPASAAGLDGKRRAPEVSKARNLNPASHPDRRADKSDKKPVFHAHKNHGKMPYHGSRPRDPAPPPPPPPPPFPDSRKQEKKEKSEKKKSSLRPTEKKNPEKKVPPDGIKPRKPKPAPAPAPAPAPSAGRRAEPFSVKKAVVPAEKNAAGEKSKPLSKPFIRLRTIGGKMSSFVPDADGDDTSLADFVDEVEEEETVEHKTWNLRPRRPPLKRPSSGSGNAPPKSGGLASSSAIPAPARLELTRSENDENLTADKKEKGKEMVKQKAKGKGKIKGRGRQKKPLVPNFSISLTTEEIAEDMYSLTGSKPSRRPRKRAKTVQKQIDAVLPGMWLDAVTRDSYKVKRRSSKRNMD